VMPDPAIKTIELPGRLTVQYAEHGRGTPLLCLHGYSDSWYSYDALIKHLPEGIRAIALTQRGHGDSDKPEGGYSMADFAGDALALLDVLGIERAAVVGHSMGSFIAQELALSHPERVSHTVLIGSATTADNAVIRELVTAVAELRDPIERAFVHEFQVSTLHQPIAESVLSTIVDESMKMPARVWAAAVAGLVAYDPGERLSGLAAPTLLIWGDKDEIFTRSEQDALVARLPQATLNVYSDAGHGTHWEQPARAAGEIAAFMAG
ncbi:MAG: alpha/beta fold hydrolase, partial [Myxococcota bacterium]